MKFGHAATINYIIGALQETDGDKVLKGLSKDQARMVHSINESMGFYSNPSGKIDDDYSGNLDRTQLAWIKDRINEVFDKNLMPIWAAKWALEILEWTL